MRTLHYYARQLIENQLNKYCHTVKEYKIKYISLSADKIKISLSAKTDKLFDMDFIASYTSDKKYIELFAIDNSFISFTTIKA